MLRLARAAAVLFAVVIGLYAADLALVGWWTSDPSIVRLDEVAQPTTNIQGEADFGSSAEDQSAAQERINQARAFDGLSTWAMATTGLVAAVLIIWFAVVFAKERRTYGPASQSSVWPYWIGLALLYVGGAVSLFFWLISPMELANFIYSMHYYLPLGLVGLFGLIAFWIASLFGIGPVLRPSVPAGARFS